MRVPITHYSLSITHCKNGANLYKKTFVCKIFLFANQLLDSLPERTLWRSILNSSRSYGFTI